jgi:hypothetical protein
MFSFRRKNAFISLGTGLEFLNRARFGRIIFDTRVYKKLVSATCDAGPGIPGEI